MTRLVDSMFVFMLCLDRCWVGVERLTDRSANFLVCTHDGSWVDVEGLTDRSAILSRDGVCLM